MEEITILKILCLILIIIHIISLQVYSYLCDLFFKEDRKLEELFNKLSHKCFDINSKNSEEKSGSPHDDIDNSLK